MNEIRISLPRGLDAPGYARSAVHALISDRNPAARDLVALITSELVTNAILHTSSTEIGLHALLWDERLRVEVTDNSPDTPLRPRRAGPNETTGRGLSIIDALALEWGVELSPDLEYKTAWATIALSRQ